MCTNKRWIINQKGQKMFVNCGSCPACLQQKAMARAKRIKNNIPVDNSVVPLFVTLTYKNHFVPYFDFDEFRTSKIVSTSHGNPLYPDGKTQYKRLRIYRNASISNERFCSSYDTRQVFKHKRVHLSTVNVPYEYCVSGADFLPMPKVLRHNGKIINQPRIGVCYYKDIQDFFKRLRINLQRKYNYDLPFSYYSCSEYGAETCRPHFHLLLFVRRRAQKEFSCDFEMFKAAITQSWPYADKHLTKRNIEIARDAASYVSSYVNCDASLPRLFKDIRPLAPHHSYSQGFGMALQSFSLGEIFKAYREGNLRYDCVRIKEGTLIVDNLLLPKYVVNRYFPKFKRFGSFTSDEIKLVSERPLSIYRFKTKYDLEDEDCRTISVILQHKQDYALSHGLTLPDFCELYANIWSLRASEVMKDFYDNICSTNEYFYAYDNIKDLYESKVESDLELLYPDNFRYIEDANEFPDNVKRTRYYEKLYHDYSKDKKVRNICISSINSKINV